MLLLLEHASTPVDELNPVGTDHSQCGQDRHEQCRDRHAGCDVALAHGVVELGGGGRGFHQYQFGCGRTMWMRRSPWFLVAMRSRLSRLTFWKELVYWVSLMSPSGVTEVTTAARWVSPGAVSMPGANDYYGGQHYGDNLYGDCIVAIDINTGKLKWYQQLVHHDIWDYDLAAAPTLINVVRNGRTIPAVAQITKMPSYK